MQQNQYSFRSLEYKNIVHEMLMVVFQGKHLVENKIKLTQVCCHVNPLSCVNPEAFAANKHCYLYSSRDTIHVVNFK